MVPKRADKADAGVWTAVKIFLKNGSFGITIEFLDAVVFSEAIPQAIEGRCREGFVIKGCCLLTLGGAFAAGLGDIGTIERDHLGDSNGWLLFVTWMSTVSRGSIVACRWCRTSGRSGRSRIPGVA